MEKGKHLKINRSVLFHVGIKVKLDFLFVAFFMTPFVC